MKIVQGQQAVTMVNLALGKKSETDAGKPSIFRMLVYSLGAVMVLASAAVALKINN